MEIRRITLKDLNRVFELLNELYTKNKIWKKYFTRPNARAIGNIKQC